MENRSFQEKDNNQLVEEISRLYETLNQLESVQDEHIWDDLIRQVAEALRNSFRAGDLNARIRGDKFA